MTFLDNLPKEAQSQQDQQTARRKVLTFVSVGVLFVDVVGLLALAVIVPFLRGLGESAASLMGSSVPGIIEFLVSINGIDYALFFIVLALILVVKEIPIRDKKATLAVNLSVAVGGMVFAFLFSIAMHVPLLMLMWDMRKIPWDTKGAKLYGSSAAPVAFWPASEKEHRITKRETVRSKYTSLDGRKLLRLQTELVVATFDLQDVIDHLDRHVHLECDRVLAERLRKESDSRSHFQCSEFTGEDSERLYFCLAYLLAQGKFVITLQSNGDIVSEITLREWSNVRGPLDGIGGQAFCLKDGRVFFWIVNWIS